MSIEVKTLSDILQHLPLKAALEFEARLFATADRLSVDYTGGCWRSRISKDGVWYYVPEYDGKHFSCFCDTNGNDALLSEETFGIVVTMFVLNHYANTLSPDNPMTEWMVDHYYRLSDELSKQSDANEGRRIID